MKVQHPPKTAWNKKTHWPKAAIKTRTDLDYTSSLGNSA